MTGDMKEKAFGKEFCKVENVSVFVAIAVYWLFFLMLGWSFFIVMPVAVGVGIVLWRFRSKRLLYASYGIVFLLACVFTVGVISSRPKTISSVVLKKWQQKRIAPESGVTITKHMVKVACENSKKGYLVARFWQSHYSALRVGEQVKLRYHTESILGVCNHRLVVDSINSRMVLSGGGRGFRGGLVDKFAALATPIVGISPFLYLIYKDYFRKGEKVNHGSKS